MKDKILAGVWIRVSPANKNGLNESEQRKEIETRATSDGSEIIKYWIDNNSGIIYPDKNKYFAQMRQDIIDDKYPVNILYMVDKARIGFINKEQEADLCLFFEKHNVQIRYINEQLLPAGAICRRSTDKQEASIEVQEDAILEFGTKQKCEIINWWNFGEEKGQSGVSIERSKDWKRMLYELQSKKHNIKNILVDEVSRLGRMTPNRKIYIQELFKDYGVPIIYIQDQFKDDGSLEDGVLQLVKHGAAYQKSKTLSTDVKKKSLVYARKGYWLSGNLYGFKRLVVDENGKLVLVNGKPLVLEKGESKQKREQRVKLTLGDTEKVNVIKRIYDIYYKEDVGFYTIAAILNREDIPSPKGGRWTPTVIRSILTNELYAGTLHYNRFTSDKWSGKTSRVPLNDQVRVENAHEAIISRELFEAVQKRIKANTGKFKIGQHPNLLKNTPKFVLNGIMFCLECARKYISAWTTRKSNIRGEYIQAYYKDSSRRTLGKQGCPDSISLHKEEIEGLVHKRIKDRLSDKEVLNNVKLRVKEKLQKVNSDENTKARIKELNVELVEIKSKIKNLSAVFSTQGMSKHIIDELQGEFEKLIINKKTVEKNIVELEKSDVDSVDIEKTCEKIMENYDKTIERLDSTSFQVQRRLVREMLHSIAVIPSKKRIYLAFYNLSKDQARKVQIDDSLIPDPIYNKIGPVDLKEDFYLKNISPSEHMYQEGKPLICYRP